MFAAWMHRQVVSDEFPIFHLLDMTIFSGSLMPQSAQE